MSFDAHKNFASTVVTAAPTPATSGTTLVVFDATVFPAVPFNAVVWPANTQATNSNAEVVRVTNISTNTLTITRVQELSSARAILVGDQISNNITAKALTDIESGFTFNYTAKTGSYGAVANDYVDCTSGTFSVTLPAASSNISKFIIVLNSGAGTITVARTGADTIGNQGETSQTLNPGDSMTFMSNGVSAWRIS